MNRITDDYTEDSPPPIFRTWNKIYGIVFFTLAIQVILFYVFTKVFE